MFKSLIIITNRWHTWTSRAAPARQQSATLARPSRCEDPLVDRAKPCCGRSLQRPRFSARGPSEACTQNKSRLLSLFTSCQGHCATSGPTYKWSYAAVTVQATHTQCHRPAKLFALREISAATSAIEATCMPRCASLQRAGAGNPAGLLRAPGRRRGGLQH